MKLKDFMEEHGVNGHYAADRKVLDECADAELLAYAFAHGEVEKDNRYYWPARPSMTMMVFRSARKLRGYVNGMEVDAVKVLQGIRLFNSGSGMTEEGKREMMLGVI